MESHTQQRPTGFTLIEMMTVVAIVGVLAAVAIPAFIRYTKKAKTSEAAAQLEKISNAARIYYYEPAFVSVGVLHRPDPQFPRSEPATPAVSCCASGGGGRCTLTAIPGCVPTEVTSE